MNNYVIDGYCRIFKPEARKQYNSGKTIYVCPSKLRPGSPWFPEISVNIQQNGNFDTMCNTISYYNCNSEAGHTLTYYIKDLESDVQDYLESLM